MAYLMKSIRVQSCLGINTRMEQVLANAQGLEAIARLRCSKGLAVEKYWGHCYRRTLTDLEFPNLSCEHSLAATLRYEDRLAENGGEAFLQFATLFTTPQGQRRIR